MNEDFVELFSKNKKRDVTTKGRKERKNQTGVLLCFLMANCI
jgi:hypothetical protein